MNNAQIAKLENLGYSLIEGSNHPKFIAGGQFCGGTWEVGEETALNILKQSETLAKLLKRNSNDPAHF